MNSTKRLVSLLLDSLTVQIIRAAVFENLYPSQIAHEVAKSKALVTKRLSELEGQGIIQGHFERHGEKVVKRFKLLDEEVTLKINIMTGQAELLKKRREEPRPPGEKKSIEKISELLR